MESWDRARNRCSRTSRPRRKNKDRHRSAAEASFSIVAAPCTSMSSTKSRHTGRGPVQLAQCCVAVVVCQTLQPIRETFALAAIRFQTRDTKRGKRVVLTSFCSCPRGCRVVWENGEDHQTRNAAAQLAHQGGFSRPGRRGDNEDRSHAMWLPSCHPACPLRATPWGRRSGFVVCLWPGEATKTDGLPHKPSTAESPHD